MTSSDAVQILERELREIFGSRLQSLVIYGQHARPAHDAHGHDHHAAPPTHTLAVIESIGAADLKACAGRVDAWHGAGLATPLLFAAHEFEQSLDAFPFEFGAILADYTVVAGENPFASLAVDPADLRRACEIQARSHLLHLREGFLETRGRADALSVLIVQSAAAFAALVTSIARLEGHPVDDPSAAARHVERILGTGNSAVGEVVKLSGVHDITSADGERLIGPYLDAVDRLVRYVDGWNGALMHARVRRSALGIRRRDQRWRSLVAFARTSSPQSSAAAPLPELTAPVNDFANVVDADSARAMDRMIRTLKAATGDVVIVETVPTIEPYGDIREYAVKQFANNGKGIGEKDKKNGLLILLALKERRVWVEVGYGLEQFITDGFAGETSREVMSPLFRQGQYGKGLAAGTERIIGRIAQGRGVTLDGVRIPRQTARRTTSSIPGWLPFVIFIVILIISRLGGGGGRRSGFWGRGGGWSSGVGPFGGGFGGGFGGFGGGGGGGGGFGGGFGGFGGGSSGGGGGGSSW